ncbi:MAG: hypothetical protein ACLFRV_00480 [Acidimicrobiales bacterium]
MPAIDREFDYLVPDSIPEIGIGDMVRISLHGRRVGGWVVATDVEPPPGVRLLALAKRSGVGPSGELIELAAWAAWRFAGRRASFLATASPPTTVARIERRPHRSDPVPVVAEEIVAAFGTGVSVLRRPPTADPVPVAVAACARGQALVLLPTVADARRMALALRRAGIEVALHPRDWAAAASGASVVGTRATAWAPAPDLAAVVVFDEHDESWQEQRAPTWHAREVAVERARRAGAACVLVSATPSLEALEVGSLSAPTRADERAGWPLFDVIDRRQDDPMRGGLWSERLTPMLRSAERAVCVLNRTGRSRLMACGRCGEVTRCEHCDGAMVQADDDGLRCRRCGGERPVICQSCGATNLRNIRAGVTRAREELEALVGEPVVEVTGASDTEIADARVYIGTEAVLHRVAAASLVAFLDIDQELLAPRYRAGEEALALLARAARLVGPRSGGGRVAVQTRVPRHDVLQAALTADPARFSAAEAARRATLRMPPETAIAEVSGQSAAAFVAALGSPAGVEVLGPSDGRYLLRAPDHDTLCDAVASTSRPPGRLRIAMDPVRV